MGRGRIVQSRFGLRCNKGTRDRKVDENPLAYISCVRFVLLERVNIPSAFVATTLRLGRFVQYWVAWSLFTEKSSMDRVAEYSIRDFCRRENERIMQNIKAEAARLAGRGDTCSFPMTSAPHQPIFWHAFQLSQPLYSLLLWDSIPKNNGRSLITCTRFALARILLSGHYR